MKDKIEEISTAKKIELICNNLSCFLVEKNIRYGDSALNPVDVFFHYIKDESDLIIINLLVRLNDKANRIINAKELRHNDVLDLVGYLMLIMIQKDWGDFEKFID